MAYTTSDIVTEARRYLPGVPDITINNTTRQLYPRFFRDSECWRVKLDTIQYAAGTQYFTPSALTPQGTRIHRIIWLAADNIVMNPGVARDAAISGIAPTGHPQMYAEYPDSDFELFPVPVKPFVLSGEAIVQPKLDYDTIPDFVAETWLLDIAAGVAGTILLMPEREWTKPQYGNALLAQYNRAVAEARLHAAGEDRPSYYTASYGGIL